MPKDIAELVLTGRITYEAAVEISENRRKLENDIEKSAMGQGAAIRTFRSDYQFNSPNRGKKR